MIVPQEQISGWGLCWLGLLLAWVIYRAIRGWLRDHEIRNMATKLNLASWAETLPSEVSVGGTMFSDGRVRNVLQGKRKSIDVVVFDWTLRVGKGRQNRTVIGARCADDPFDARKFDYSLTTERSGGWVFLYESSSRFSGFMPVSEIEAHLDALG